MKLRPDTFGVRSIKSLSLSAFCSLVVFGLSSLSAMASTLSVSSSVPTGATYTINLPNYSVTDIEIFNYGSPFATTTLNQTNPLTALAGTTPTTLTTTFLTAAEVGNPSFVYTPGNSFMLGVATNLAGDAQQHLVLFANNTFASTENGVAFETAFPASTLSETTLINYLTNIADGSDINTFAGSDPSAFGFALGSSFSAIAFSDGQLIGTGTSSLTYASAAPEPSTWAMMILGFCGLGCMTYRRKSKPAFLAA